MASNETLFLGARFRGASLGPLLVVLGAGSGEARPGEAALTEGSSPYPTQEQKERVPLEVEIDRDTVDLENHRLSLTMSRPPDFVRVKVIGESGTVLADEETSFRGRPAGRLTVSWRPSTDEPVARIEVYAHDIDGYYKGIAITPWSLSIPHEEVHFETNASDIRATEEPKLQASLRMIKDAYERHKDLGAVSLFIVGHTDTVGTEQHNQQLSERRARSIAHWFRSHGLTLPIGYAGAGELAPKVRTKDNVDEPRNRRVDYLLALETPRLKAGGQTLIFRKL